MSEPDVVEDVPLADRFRANPRPALLWALGALALLALEFGALANATMEVVPWERVGAALPGALTGLAAALAGVGDALANVPTLLSRETIPNEGYRVPGEGWQETFLGLSPGWAWALRAGLIYAYAFAWLAWLWRGYLAFRRHYRFAAWTPRDDMIDRLRGHHWGQFGFVVVCMFVVMAIFAPAMGPATVDGNIRNPYSHTVQYWDEAAGGVAETTAGQANLDAGSKGDPATNVGPLSYDDHGRFHPFGTLPTGKDLFTFMAAGARVSLLIGVLAMGLAGLVALAFATLTAYYKGLLDLGVVIASDSIMVLPQLLVLILLSAVLTDTWIARVYNGGFLLALIFAATTWPYLWRALRGPAFQVSEQEWIDAARSFGQRPAVTMRKHMAPYVIGYLLIYVSMFLGGTIIAISALSFLGLGVNAPTPEWGRAIDAGQPYVATASWHISLIPGLLIVLVVTAFNALGDGIRDAIDPQSGVGGGTEAAAAGGGGA